MALHSLFQRQPRQQGAFYPHGIFTDYLLDQAYLFSPGSETSRWAFDWDLKGFHPNTALSEYIFWSRAWLER